VAADGKVDFFFGQEYEEGKDGAEEGDVGW
jgi:hypothetical protein